MGGEFLPTDSHLAARELTTSLSCLDVEINNAFLAESNIPLTRD